MLPVWRLRRWCMTAPRLKKKLRQEMAAAGKTEEEIVEAVKLLHREMKAKARLQVKTDKAKARAQAQAKTVAPKPRPAEVSDLVVQPRKAHTKPQEPPRKGTPSECSRAKDGTTPKRSPWLPSGAWFEILSRQCPFPAGTRSASLHRLDLKRGEDRYQIDTLTLLVDRAAFGAVDVGAWHRKMLEVGYSRRIQTGLRPEASGLTTPLAKFQAD